MTATNQAFIRAYTNEAPSTELRGGPSCEPPTGLPFAPHFPEVVGSARRPNPVHWVSAAPLVDRPTEAVGTHVVLPDQFRDAPGVAEVSLPQGEDVQAESVTTRARPHVQFPPTIRLDVADRRHTRLTDENEGRHESGLQPLSEFTAPVKGPPFRPEFEVDQFRWPELCHQIADDSGACLDALIEQIVLGADRGHSVIAVVGDRPGVGCTTGVLCMAARLGAWGARVALVDVSFTNPVLAERLGLAVSSGWEDVISGDIPFSDAVVASIADQAALLPVRTPIATEAVADHICSIPAAIGIDVLRENYDVTLLDVGSPTIEANGTPLVVRFAARVGAEGVVAVRSADNSEPDSNPSIEEQLAVAGIPTIGTIVNFSPRVDG